MWVLWTFLVAIAAAQSLTPVRAGVLATTSGHSILALAGPDLAAGTALTIVDVNEPRHVQRAVVAGPVDDAPSLAPHNVMGPYYAIEPLRAADTLPDLAVGIVGRADVERIDTMPTLRLGSPALTIRVRSCASSEGLHVTLWDGEPLHSRRLWHAYYYVGYDLTPNCEPGDYAGGAGAVSCEGLPLAPGTTWTYRADVAWAASSGDSIGRRTIPWTTTVSAVRASDSAVVATVEGWSTDLAWWTPEHAPSTSVLYCAGGRIFLLHPGPGTTAELVDALLDGTRRPIEQELAFRFPMRTGDLYGRDAAERGDNMYAWLVESAAPPSDSVRNLTTGVADSVYTIVYRSLPDHSRIDFVPGLGVVHYVYQHNGTTATTEAWLVAFRPGARQPGDSVRDGSTTPHTARAGSRDESRPERPRR